MFAVESLATFSTTALLQVVNGRSFSVLPIVEGKHWLPFQ